MARKIFGYITEKANSAPIAGACIKAWDEDIGEDDFMGESLTDKQGYYEIKYSDNLWDTIPHAGSFARPDIYITVSIKNAINEWVAIGQSSVHMDHILSEDLQIDLDCTIERPVAKQTDFDPFKHGFHFYNNFELTPQLFNVKFDTWNMGFCGGMCAGALHRFAHKIQIMPDTDPPAQGHPLFNELLARQITSMATILVDIYDWQSAPDATRWYRKHSVGYRTKKQWPHLKEELDAGRPAILVLIRSAGYFANPTYNHQVVAAGYEYNPSTGDLKIHTYDPNWPDTATYLTFNFGLPDDRINAQDSTGDTVRGFFVNPNTSIASQ